MPAGTRRHLFCTVLTFHPYTAFNKNFRSIHTYLFQASIEIGQNRLTTCSPTALSYLSNFFHLPHRLSLLKFLPQFIKRLLLNPAHVASGNLKFLCNFPLCNLFSPIQAITQRQYFLLSF